MELFKKKVKDLLEKENESFKKNWGEDILDQSMEAGYTLGRLDFAQDLYDSINEQTEWEVLNTLLDKWEKKYMKANEEGE